MRKTTNPRKINFRALCPEVPKTDYLTHGLHTYTAKFIPQMPRYFIKKYCKAGDWVFDPFSGSGTTLLEALTCGCNAAGTEISPLARLISEVKTSRINPNRIKDANKIMLRELKKKTNLKYDVNFQNLDYWFHKKVIFELRKIFSVINELHERKIISNSMKNYYLVNASSVIRKSSYADPLNPKTYCSPRIKKMKKKGLYNSPIQFFEKSIFENIDGFNETYSKISNEQECVLIKSNDARNFEFNRKFDLIVTSPPYANAQEYFRNIKLELYWLKLANQDEMIELDKLQIGGQNHSISKAKDLHLTGIANADNIIKQIFKIDRKKAFIVFKYFRDMEYVIKNCYRHLKKNKHLVIIVGNNTVRGIQIPIQTSLIKIAQKNGFSLHSLDYDVIRNRHFMITRNNNAPPITKDWIIDLVKK